MMLLKQNIDYNTLFILPHSHAYTIIDLGSFVNIQLGKLLKQIP